MTKKETKKVSKIPMTREQLRLVTKAVNETVQGLVGEEAKPKPHRRTGKPVGRPSTGDVTVHIRAKSSQRDAWQKAADAESRKLTAWMKRLADDEIERLRKAKRGG
jgi:hypothetical protein